MLDLDRRAETWIVTHRVGALDPLFKGLTEIGKSGAVWLALGLALALWRRRAELLVAVAAADLLADLLAAAVQLLVRRARPDVHLLVARPASFSFPSGHAATSIACAVVLGALEPRLRLPALLLAAAIAYSRLYVGVHYPLDTLGGATIGAAVGLAVLGALAARDPRRRAAGRPR